MGLLSRFVGAAENDVQKRGATAVQQRQRHPGVEVVANGDSCCDAARKIAGQRFLSKEAPRLPLTGCDQKECKCRYQHYTDRRTETRRDGDIGIGTASEMFHQDCRRSNGRGRRDSD